MGSITGNFQSETPLHPVAREFLLDAFDRGWADPDKSPSPSRQAAILLNQAKESLAGHLKVATRQLHFLADPVQGFHLGLAGLLRPGSTLHFSAVDRSEVHALARMWGEQGERVETLPVTLQGQTGYPVGSSESVLSWQASNGETGIRGHFPAEFAGKVFVDATADGNGNRLPENWNFALWNSQSWQGPAGLGLYAISDESRWNNPLPHLQPGVPSSSFSPPLAMASALAAEAYAKDYQGAAEHIAELNRRIRSFVSEQIGEVDIAGNVDDAEPKFLSISFLYVDAERLVHELDAQGFYVDSGSACSSSALEPSHVLAAMGVLTHGNIRLTLRADMTLDGVERFLHALQNSVEKLRA